MQEHHSRVNFRKLVRDLADMYDDATFDVVLTELVANALDAKATRISIDWDSERYVLVVGDNGHGMDSEAFAQYHDFAAELKTRGDGIGFAGMGAKISFNIADKVMTETRCDGAGSASDWRWHSDGSLRWNPMHSDTLHADGTRVEVHFRPDDDLRIVDAKYLEAVLTRHYFPLFISDFLRAYQRIGIYSSHPRFKVNGLHVPVDDLVDRASLTSIEKVELRSGTRSIGWGAIGVSREDGPIGDDSYGVLLCTYGKAIKPELFGLSTGLLGARLFGIVEIPELIQYITTNKTGLKGGPGRTTGLNRLLGPVRDELKSFLAQHGVTVAESRRNRLSAKLERELTRMLRSLPELQDFDGLLRRSQRLRKSGDEGIPTSPRTSPIASDTVAKTESGSDVPTNSSNGTSRKGDEEGKTPAKRQRSRNKHGPRVAFEEHPARSETAWLESNTVVINSGHSAYRQRINQDQARLTYCMFAIGVALDKADLVESNSSISYVDKFISAWGGS